jgi:Family of unknown function (DUF6527)
MKPIARIRHEFVEYIPTDVKGGTLYISIQYSTAIHKCCCGCGNEVVTPLSPTDWKLIFNGETVSLAPSIGNWSFDCKSHYLIEDSNVRWAPRWSRQEIEDGRARDREAKRRYFESRQRASDARVVGTSDMNPDTSKVSSPRSRAKKA